MKNNSCFNIGTNLVKLKTCFVKGLILMPMLLAISYHTSGQLVCFPPSDPCEKIKNADFEQNSGGIGAFDFDFQGNPVGELCYWEPTVPGGFFCNNQDGNTAIGIFINTINNISASDQLSTTYPLDLMVNTEYEFSFKYLVFASQPNVPPIPLIPWPEIRIGLTQSPVISTPLNTTYLVNSAMQSGLDGFANLDHSCYPTGMEFHTFNGSFIYTGDGRKYLNISGFNQSLPFNNSFIQARHTIFIDDVSIRRCNQPCTLVPSFTSTYSQDSCTVTFTGLNTGSPGTYHWDFGDGFSGEGQTSTHKYLIGGEYEVCLTVTCDEDPETSEQVCNSITIPSSCEGCIELRKPVVANICLESETGPNTYNATFSFDVPKGTHPCPADELLLHSPQVDMTILDYQINDTDPQFDVVTVSLAVTVAAGETFPTHEVHSFITMCVDEGNPVCFVFQVLVDECDVCYSLVSSLATCTDPISTDNVFIYSGVINLTLIGLLSNTAIFDGYSSPEPGFEITNMVRNGSNWSINYTITTENPNFNQTTALISFTVNTTIKHCVPINITVNATCIDEPETCIAEWSTKPGPACTVANGQVIFDFPNMYVTGPNSNYSLCQPSGLYGSIEEGGTVTVTSASVQGANLWFDISLSIPQTSFVSGQVYHVRLFLCDGEGNIVCYRIPWLLTCLGTGGGGEGGGGGLIVKPNARYDNGFVIFPNPAYDKLNIVTPEYKEGSEIEVKIQDHFGRVVSLFPLASDRLEISLTKFVGGIYFITVLQDGLPVKTEKIIVME